MLKNHLIDGPRLKTQLDEFEAFLLKNAEFEERAALKFFKHRKDLVALMDRYNLQLKKYDLVGRELGVGVTCSPKRCHS
ncbi:MAG: hypothetical protein HYW49_00025 [Deltaproteobacteria bacterium]|nr:hypothetical protein [Deltaproteobacteria bacterium]